MTPDLHPLRFDRFAVVDWSGANVPRRGADSIWIAASGRASRNPATREAATQELCALIDDALVAGERLMIGLDFAFGLPAGFARAVGLRDWEGVWAHLHAVIRDNADNASNRFDVAAQWNRMCTAGEGPFWGYTMKAGLPDSLSRKSVADWRHPFSYRREVERRQRGASPVFKLAYAGSVGSQSLLGIARLEAVRRRYAGRVAVWPFETGFADDLSAPVVLTEIYPSRHTVRNGPEVLDRRQVEAVLRDFEAWNGAELTRQLAAPSLAGAGRDRAVSEEGWLLGL